MDDFEVVTFRDEMYPQGFRKIFALLMIVGVTVMPPVIFWENEPDDRRGASSMPTGRYRPHGGFLPEPEEESSGFLAGLWAVLKRVTVVLLTTISLMIYYPRRGFKRYALLCGPLIALLVPLAVGWYLEGRNIVYRFEIALVMLVAMLPGAALYVTLAYRKARKLGMTM